ncbi:MAG: lipid-A-disaccharide synthase [Chlamydiales bacterium]
MTDTLRSLFYPLGLIANCLFGFRVFFQWIQSERKGESILSPSFWRISLIANGIMSIHGFIQLQYPVCLIQALNGVIAWRNLNLMHSNSLSQKKTFAIMSLAIVIISLVFAQQDVWMSPPKISWYKNHLNPPNFAWHLVGYLGMFLFTSRFWLQWWLAEKHQTSCLGKPFWWMSLSGASLSLVYFIRLADPVNIIGYGFGLLPYIRNLMLIKPNYKIGKDLFIFAGEPSGDVLGAQLVKTLKKNQSNLIITGVGGPLMSDAGMNITYPMELFQVMGFSDVIKRLPLIYLNLIKISNQILKMQPIAVVLIDYPDFNMHLAKKLRKKGYAGKLIHYVSPSIWAWRKGRIKTLVKTLDSLLSILPFEKEYFNHTSLPVTYVGHPLVSAIKSHIYQPPILFPKDQPILAIFPGSRRQEIALNLPIQWEVAKQFPDFIPCISVAHPYLIKEIKKHTGSKAHLVPQDKRYDLMQAATLALATCGTIVLEIGLHALPTVVIYKLTPMNYLMGRYIFRIDLQFYNLVNIICKRHVYPEFIDRKLSIDKITRALKSLNPKQCYEACRELTSHLSDYNASEKAAQIIKSLIT